MTAAEGWAAQQLRLPAHWYDDMPTHEIGFPISGDATAAYTADQNRALKEKP